jgi:N6-L-threonylcarbamoyladenine synthase
MRDFFASFQAAVVDALVANAMSAERAYGSGKIAVTGGVAANGALRARFRDMREAAGGKPAVFFPEPALCTDNAAMVAARAYHDYRAGAFSPMALNASPSAAL